MQIQKMMRRLVPILLTLFLMAGTVAAKTPAAYTMTVHNGFVAVQENATGDWIYCSDIPAQMLSHRDQLLLEAGILLENRADFTRAIEDFCS